MSEPAERAVGAPTESEDLENLGHPRGTLAIVIGYALLFALAWLGLYVFEFMSRGAPQP
jgi:hypothetical protein